VTIAQVPTSAARVADVSDAVNAYLGWLKRRDAAPATLKKYNPYLETFADWAGHRHPADISSWEIDGLFLAEWEARFERRRGRAPSRHSKRGMIGALSSFYGWLHKFSLLVDEEGKQVTNPMLAIDAPRVPPKQELDWLTPEQDELLLECQMSPGETILVWFLRFTGLRLAEALSLRISDVDLMSGLVHVQQSKTARGIRSIPICDELRLQINRWLDHLRKKGLYDPNGPFFATRNRTAMKPQQAEKWIRRVGDRAGIPNLTPHRLRRTLGSRLYQDGLPLDRVSMVLGHADTRTTELYYARLRHDQARNDMLAVLNGRTARPVSRAAATTALHTRAAMPS
jgi:integrase